MRHHGIRPRALIVEDDPDIAAVLVLLLEEEGYAARAAVGQWALDIAFAHPPQVVLLDLMMPQLSSPEVCHRLRDEPRTRDAAVIFMTAAPPEVFAAQLASCDYEALIRKPFDLYHVIRTVNRFVK